MAFYRTAGYIGNLVRETQEIPDINTPEKGEPLLLEALAFIEDYAKNLTVASNRLSLELKNCVEKSSDIAIQALTQNREILEKFNSAAQKEIDQFDKLMTSVDFMSQSFQEIDQLYSDVLRLSDILTSLEQYAAK